MHLAGLGKKLWEQHSGCTRGFVILNALGGCWDMNLYPTIPAAMKALGGYRHRGRFRIVPATRTLSWQRASSRAHLSGDSNA